MSGTRHHPFCTSQQGSSDNCTRCNQMHQAYPMREGETAEEVTARYFPREIPEPAPIIPQSPAPLVMVQRGRQIIQANEAMAAAHVEVKEVLDELEVLLRQKTTERRISRKGEEAERIETVRETQIKATRRRTERILLSTDGHTRTVRKVKTTASKLEKDGKLSRDLAICLGAFAQGVAEGHGAATMDGHDSTNRLTAGYDVTSTGGGFASRTYSDRQLDGLRMLKEMQARVPDELMPVFQQIVEEEVAGQSPLARTLVEIGARLGYKDAQARAGGGALVYAVTCIVAHYMRERGFSSKLSTA